MKSPSLLPLLPVSEQMNIRGKQTSFFLVFGFVLWLNSMAVHSQDEATEPKIDFTKVIKPILEARCTTCHNEADEEGGVNLDDLDVLAEYVTAGEPLESPLFQSLTAAGGLSQMPPEEDNDGNLLDPCTPSEMALIYMWIRQGASLEGVKVEQQEEEKKSSAYRLFLFSGYFHPAIVHFPIALITISAFFIIFFFRNDALSDDAAFFLLLFGTLASIAASVMGWAFADKNPVAITDFSIGINRHRWFGIGATVLALISTILGWRARNEVLANRSGAWKFGVILTAALMGWVGHQGGEEVYGEGMYERAAEKLIPEFWPFGFEEKEKPNKGGDEKANNKSDEKKSTAGDQDKNKKSEATNDEKGEPADSKNDDSKSGEKADESKNEDSKSPPVDPTIKGNQ